MAVVYSICFPRAVIFVDLENTLSLIGLGVGRSCLAHLFRRNKGMQTGALYWLCHCPCRQNSTAAAPPHGWTVPFCHTTKCSYTSPALCGTQCFTLPYCRLLVKDVARPLASVSSIVNMAVSFCFNSENIRSIWSWIYCMVACMFVEWCPWEVQ